MTSTLQDQSLTKSLRQRLQAIADDIHFPIRLSVDETEEVIRLLWEFVGLMGAQKIEVTQGGYEQHVLERARHWAQELQTAMLAAVAHAGQTLVEATVADGDEADQEFGQFDSAEGGTSRP